jgi:hypothetical protein
MILKGQNTNVELRQAEQPAKPSMGLHDWILTTPDPQQVACKTNARSKAHITMTNARTVNCFSAYKWPNISRYLPFSFCSSIVSLRQAHAGNEAPSQDIQKITTTKTLYRRT